MNAHTNHQIINGPDGMPAFVVIPYSEYMQDHPKDDLIPNEVVGMVVRDGVTMIAAWRKHLGITQTDMAKRIGISQAAYAQQETAARPRKTTLQKIAMAMGISVDQLTE